MSNAMAPTVSTISGSTWVIEASGMAFTAKASLRQRGGFRRAERILVVVEERRHRRRRHVEHGLRIEAEQQGQHDQRRENRGLAPTHVGDGGEARLVEPGEDDLSVEAERVAGRQDDDKR